jgi:hypothetical protein
MGKFSDANIRWTDTWYCLPNLSRPWLKVTVFGDTAIATGAIAHFAAVDTLGKASRTRW